MVQVEVSEGLLEGEVLENEHGGSYCSFKGIPYAAPPLGDLRFQAPKPPKQWQGIRSAKEFGPICYQLDLFNKAPPSGSEDCLYLNVYSPDVAPSKPLPVMFWIHGGGFVSGSGDDSIYSPEFLVKHGVVLVTINYRLEVLGFLCLDTEEVPGNAAMKDQVAALRWVYKNIRSFGGDPDNITIFGESAGAACVGYHIVSPMTKGLFKRAIIQSGSATCWWAHITDAKDRALSFARQLGYKSDNDEGLYEFFKSQPKESLIGAKAPLTLADLEKTSFTIPFVVVSEKQFGDNERFFYGDVSYETYTKNIHEGVEIFTGFTTDEGLIALFIGSGLEKKMSQLSRFVEEFVPKPISYSCSTPQILEVGKKLKEYYFGKRDLVIEDWETLMRFYSVEFFMYGVIQLAKIIASAKKNKVYLYHFSCISDRNHFTSFLGCAELAKGKQYVSHCDDLLYLFDGKLFPKVDNASETYKLIERVSTIWTNFAKYGNPTPDDSLEVKCPEYTLEKQEYLDIGRQLTIGASFKKEEIELWEDIFRKYAPDYVNNHHS